MRHTLGVAGNAAAQELAVRASEPDMQQAADAAPGMRERAETGEVLAMEQSPGEGSVAALTAVPALQRASGSEVCTAGGDQREEAVRDLAWCIRLAEQDDAQAQYELGTRYLEGKGAERNHEQAFKWLSKSAQQGHAGGQVRLGDMYWAGLYVDGDRKQAFEWFSKSAQQGHAGGQVRLGEMYLVGHHVEADFPQWDFPRAFEWFSKSAQQGHAGGQYRLGEMYLYGNHVKRDFRQAFEWLGKSVQQGHDAAQRNLSLMYRDGKGTARDATLAASWFMKSAGWGKTGTTSLTLSHFKVDDEMLAAIASSLRGDMAITSLDLSGNLIGDEGVKRLVVLFEENLGLRALQLQSNSLSEAGLTAIAKAMRHNTTLMTIWVDACSTMEERQALLIYQETEANRRIDGLLRQQQSWEPQGWSGYPLELLSLLEQSLIREGIKLRYSSTEDTLARLKELQLCLQGGQL